MMASMRKAAIACALLVGLTGTSALGGDAQAQDRLGPGVLAPGGSLGVQAAAPPRVETVAILILSGDESGIPLSEVYSGARNAIEEHTAINVAPFDEIRLAVRDAAVRECAGKAACFARKVRGGTASLLLTVSVDSLGDGEGLLLGLRLVDIESEQQIGAAGDEIPAGMSLRGAMEQQLPEVFPRSVWNQIGELLIRTTPTNAEVMVAGRSCASPCDLKRLIPGTYEVTIRKSGYLDWKGSTTVVAQKSVTLDRTLLEPEGGIASSPWFWGGIGLAAIGAGVAALLVVRADDQLVNVCIARDPTVCGG